ncbi:hypothetical protein NEF87_004354 [Candidatus Lokiarchaeum ossiferum]|uniref:GtrA/DPMS transmembrane domain-containing protein n=1 Tax=Candidatus Lokiarchaeum ossiferum TaxID=2951803 RepID=A0ABY6HX12_9ARCH|nr:hypothetical protein NEF87_004354 [Candidatus Lokiarchaeum sp. B-35]
MEESFDDPPPKDKFPEIIKQAILYFSFAIAMIILNILVQNLFEQIIFPFVDLKLGDRDFFKNIILSTNPYNIPELIGSIFAVGITYVIKFVLDKLFVFKKTDTTLKQTSKEFSVYLLLAVLTTLENLGIQFILGIVTIWALNLRIGIALTCGYITKFFLDKRFVFNDQS